MITEQKLMEKLGVFDIRDKQYWNITLKNSVLFFDKDLNIFAARRNGVMSMVDNPLNLYHDICKYEPIYIIKHGQKTYCCNCGQRLDNMTREIPLCPRCARVISHEERLYTTNTLSDWELALSESDGDYTENGMEARINAVHELLANPLVHVTSDVQLMFEFDERIQQHFRHDGRGWRINARTNERIFQKMVPNINMFYKFTVANISSDLTDFLDMITPIVIEHEESGNAVCLNAETANELRYNYVATHRDLSTQQYTLIDITGTRDEAAESFHSLVPLLVDAGVLSVRYSGELALDFEAMKNVDRVEANKILSGIGGAEIALDVKCKGE